MKILFLDIDGVLNNDVEMTKPKNIDDIIYVDGEAFVISSLQILSKIVSEFDCKIVLSSDWRLWEKSRETISTLLKIYNMEYIDITPSFGRIRPRGIEIQKWLDDHPEVTEFVILDDISNMVYLTDHLILTDYKKGLVWSDYEKFIQMRESKQLERRK